MATSHFCSILWVIITAEIAILHLTTEASEMDVLVQEGVFNPDNYDETKTFTAAETGEFCEPTGTQHSLLLKPDEHIPRAVIGCQEPRDPQPIIDVTNDLTLSNLVVKNIHLNLTNDMKLILVNCVLINTTIKYNSNEGSVSLLFVDTTFKGHVNGSCLEEMNCGTSSSISTHSKNLTIWYLACTFLQTQQNLSAIRLNKFQIDNSTFSNDDSLLPSHSALHIVVWAITPSVKMTIRNSTFEKQLYTNPVDSVLNIFDAALWIKVAIDRSSRDLEAAVTLNIQGSTFRNNERVLALIGKFKLVNIDNCTFAGNEAIHSGAAILSLVDKQSSIFITNTTFRDNVAGSYNLLKNLPKDGSIRVTDEDIYIQTQCCNGAVKLVGKGGAIRSQRGQMTIKTSSFVNNSASLYGGSIFVDQNSNLLLQDCDMDNSVHLKTEADDIIHSKGALKITKLGIHVKAKGQDTDRAVIYHAGDHWSAEIDELYIKCPVGYNIETRNQSAYGMTNVGLRRSYFVDQIAYWCKPCRYGYDGTDFGYLNYTLKYKTFAYYTLLINGEKPEGSQTGFLDHHRVSCNKYPDERSSSSFYWSYIKGSESQTMECPAGYCSSEKSNSKNDMCAANRSGTLCGQCNLGYAQLYFTTECIQNDDCHPATFWLTYLFIGVFYVLLCTLLAWLAFKGQRSRSCTLLDQRVTFRGQTVELERVSDTVNLTASSSRRESAQSIQDAGFITADIIIIIMYYCQDVQLFHRATHGTIVSSDIYNDYHDITNSVLALLTRFNWEIFAWVTNLCSFNGATALGNQIVAVIFVPSVIMVFGAACTVWLIVTKRNEGRYTYISEGWCNWACQLLWHGMFLALLLTYQGNVLQSAPLLKCVPYMNETVLFLNGNIPCFQDWQYVVVAYIALWLAPFPIVLIIGPPLLRERHLSLPQYILLCILPVPMLSYLLIQTVIRKIQGGLITIRLELNSASSLTAEFLQGSQRDLPFLLKYLCCHGIIVMFRFAMVMMYTFNDDVLRGMVGLLILVFTKLVYSAVAQPYSSTRSNWLSVCGDAALLLVGGTNMAARIIYLGNVDKYTNMFMMFEAIFCVWLPSCAILIGVIVIVIKRLKK